MPDEHEKYRAKSYVCAGGGSAANTAVELSRLGRKVTIVGGIGTDDLGNIALRSLIEAGVNIANIVRRSDWKTGCAAIRSQGNSKDRSALDTCLERGLRSAAIVLGQVGPQHRSDS
jgi:ribokinase